MVKSPSEYYEQTAHTNIPGTGGKAQPPGRGICTRMAGQAGATLRLGITTPPRQTAQGRYLLSDSCLTQTPAWENQHNKMFTNPEHSFSISAPLLSPLQGVGSPGGTGPFSHLVGSRGPMAPTRLQFQIA